MTTKTKLIAFHGKQEIKDEYIARVKAHAKADEIIKGTYWEEGKGCAVGCTVHSDSHKAYEEELGVPRVLARLEDRIFEGMSNEKAKEFPLKFLSVIKVGADLSQVWNKFAVWLLEDIRKYVKGEGKAFDKVVDTYKRMINGEHISLEEWRIIRDEAWNERRTVVADDAAAYAAYAAYAAANAAYAAAYTAVAAYAAAYTAVAAYDAAYTAADAAYADAAYAAYAAANAAYAAAYTAVTAYDARRKSYDKQAEKLLELLGDSL